MKVALCLFGIVGGKIGKGGGGGDIDPSVAYNCYEKHIISKNDVDVYFHTWSVSQLQTLTKMYNPIKFAFEKQVIFSKDGYKQRAHSRWYSTKKSIGLVGDDYDMIMLSRFDVAFFRDVIFDDYDPEYFYASHWNDVGNRENHKNGFLDLWFFGGAEVMRKFGKLYDFIGDYGVSQHKSSMQHIKSITNDIKYVMYRGEDFEMVRRTQGCKK